MQIQVNNTFLNLLSYNYNECKDNVFTPHYKGIAANFNFIGYLCKRLR